MPYLPYTEQEKQRIFREIGVSSLDDLIQSIPSSLRHPQILMSHGLSEIEVQRQVLKLGSRNTATTDFLSFLGAGSYEHFIPSAVQEMVARQEFTTAYTPYQPEASQGTLQVIFEYQSLMAELTGLAASNASHYDGATSLAEAALVALRQTDRTKILVARSLHPHYCDVIRTYLAQSSYQVEEFGFLAHGGLDLESLQKKLTPDVAGVILQTPNFFGGVEDLNGVSDRVHANGSLLIVSGHPLSFALYRSPGEWGADIAAGEGQPLGMPLGFGGPYLGYFVASQSLLRRIPGRIAGLTEDADGKRAFCLTLQAREQHIRRERAGSNICSNQALCALAACVYMTFLGKQGMREVAELNVDRAHYLRERVAKIKGFKVDLERPIFNEFVIHCSRPVAEICKKMMAARIFPGVRLGDYYPEFKDCLLVCATETKTGEDLDRFLEVLSQC
ncbi:MAG TPA: aminomethyl-transferring glycine dehydrogenase subunit GcvPA [Candidatus Omnitrophota bacterium]|nr:aminomethyl-transferring glycine dehydrogenase subunit GcvPA [Candidatus Omnitrophota bacterium]HQB11553.1 aminomethyl-transferring glycine dehydrogenase subunit GcvPA [Candidatus Omnitrophota bacterium]